MNMDILQITPRSGSACRLNEACTSMSEKRTLNPIHSLTRSGSRLHDDFDNIEEIGKGAYGHVVKARGKVDGKVFAIKKVRLNNDQIINMLEQNVFHEVRHLAELNHENVVCYFDSWMEKCIDDASDNDDDDGDEEEEEEEDEKEDTNVVDDDDDYIHFIESDDGSEIMFRNSGSSSRPKMSGLAIGSSKPGQGNFASITGVDSCPIKASHTRSLLCIKMEYCEHGTLRTAIDNGLFRDIEISWRFLRDILNGLEYIHRKDIIHRDLNPNNIFIGSNDSAKIGDFGIATFEIPTGDSSNTTTPSSTLSDFRRQRSNLHDLSGKVGTALYAAPEVQKPTSATVYTYDTSADMYSLGLIVFEMIYQPIQTFMEKSKIFDSLKKQSYPDAFSESELLPQITIINNLLSVDPQSRNTASNLLNPENHLLPCEPVEEKHLQKMKIAVRDPKSKERAIFLKEVFDTPDDAELPSVSSMYEVVMPKAAPSRTFYEQKLLDAFRNACRLHGAIEVTLPSVVTARNKNDVIKLIDETGDKLALIDGHMIAVGAYLSKECLSDASIYCTQPVYRQSGNKLMPNRKLLFSFHLVNQKQSVITVAETLCLFQKFILLGTNSSSLKAYTICITSFEIINGVLDICEVSQKVRDSLLKCLFHNIDLCSINISIELVNKLVRIIDACGSLTAVKNIVEGEFGHIGGALLSVFDELQNIIKTAILMGLSVPIHVRVRPMSITPIYRTGVQFCFVKWERRRIKQTVAVGGDGTSFSHFWTRDNGECTAAKCRSGDLPSWIYLNIYVDHIISAAVESQEGKFADSIRVFSCDVVVHFDAGRHEEGIYQICKLRGKGVRAKLMEGKPSEAHLKDYERLGVTYVVSIDNDSGRGMATVIDVRIGNMAREVLHLCQINFMWNANNLELIINR